MLFVVEQTQFAIVKCLLVVAQTMVAVEQTGVELTAHGNRILRDVLQCFVIEGHCFLQVSLHRQRIGTIDIDRWVGHYILPLRRHCQCKGEYQAHEGAECCLHRAKVLHSSDICKLLTL